MERLLITKEDFKGYRHLSDKIDPATQLDPFILEAQLLDLSIMLGETLYSRLQSILKRYDANLLLAQENLPGSGDNAATGLILVDDTNNTATAVPVPLYQPNEDEAEYLKLVNGTSFEVQGFEYVNPGLKPVLVYLTFARYVRNAHILSSQTGFIKSVNQYSEPVSRTEINDMATSAVNDAQVYMRKVHQYIDAHRALLKLPQNNICAVERKDPKRQAWRAIRGGTIITGRKRLF